MTRVLITGVAGFLGGRLAEWLLANVPGAEVFGVDDLSCGYVENVPERVQWRQVSVGWGDPCFAPWFADVRPDYVFHLAAYAAEGLSPFIRCYNSRCNHTATCEVLNACLNAPAVKRLIYTSSMAVYGRGVPPFDESAPRAPIDPYGVAKAACEQEIEIAGQQHGLDWCIVRPHNLYGPGQSIWQRYRNVLGIWMARHLQGLPLLIYGDGQQQRAFSWIDDCLPCLWRAAVAPAASRQTINLGGARPVTIDQAATLCAAVMGGASIQRAEARHEARAAWCTTAKSEEMLGHCETITLGEGLERMWAWAQEAWEKFPQRRGSDQSIRIEVDRGLYPFWR